MKFREPIVCKDGFSVSVQASSGHYCTPRNDEGPYDSVELGFPSAKPIDEIMKYAEDKENPTDTVYGYVPVDLVIALLKEHGGPVDTECFMLK